MLGYCPCRCVRHACRAVASRTEEFHVTTSRPPVRTVVWSTGGVGSIAIDAIRRRPDLELVGVWVHSTDKVGKDAGELANGEPIGLAATNDADALIALNPDCVVYAASGPDRDGAAVPDYLKFLSAGINVVS